MKRAAGEGGAKKKSEERTGPEPWMTEGTGPRAVERPWLTVDVVVFAVRDDELDVLVVERGVPPYEGMDALPGGFVRAGETVEQAAARELVEETGVSGVYSEQLYTFSEPERDPRGRVVSVAHLALMPGDRVGDVVVKGGTDARSARWARVSALVDVGKGGEVRARAKGKEKLAFDHDAVLAMALGRLRGKLEYTTLGFRLLPSEFTLSEAQRVHELVLGREIDKVSFRRRVEAMGLVRETGGVRTGAHRPARLYSMGG